MKKITSIVLVLILVLSARTSLKAQILDVPEIIQEQTQWCWSATSLCVLTYFNHPNTQCAIAEYARSVITWYNFGTVNCCTDPSQGCNYWNYMFNSDGSLEDLLLHFGNISVQQVQSSISLQNLQSEIAGGHPIVFRWGWTAGGGHFLIGHGIQDSTMYYMNPLPGYGYEIADYDWVVSDGSAHFWTHTLLIPNACPPPQTPGPLTGSASVCKDASEMYSIAPVAGVTDYSWELPLGWTGNSNTTSMMTTVGSYSGPVAVAANNACGSSYMQTIDVNVEVIDKSVVANGQTLISNASPTAAYQWVSCQGMQAVPGATSQTFAPTQSGTYAAIITQNNCVDTSNCHAITVSGIEFNNYNFKVDIYPNPSNSFLNINFTDPEMGKYYFVLTDVYGQVVNKKVVEISGNVFEMKMDISECSAGIYFLNLKTGEKSMVYKILKN